MPRLRERGSCGRARVRLAATISTVALVITVGCNGEERTEPAAWADSVCDGFQDYAARLDDLAPRLEEGLDQGAGPDETKRLIQDYLRDALRATDSLEEDLVAAGTPDVDGGTAVAEGLRHGAESSGRLLQGALDEAGDLPTGDAGSFEARVKELSRRLTGGMAEVSPDLGEAPEELEAVLAERPTCRDLG